MKLLVKIASRLNLIALIFQNFPVGACPQTPQKECASHTACVPTIFIAIAFSGPPSHFLPCYAHAIL